MPILGLEKNKINEVYVLLQMDCELRCRVCPYWGLNGSCKEHNFVQKYCQGQKLDLGRLLDFIDEVSAYKPRTITLSGGEPLEYDDWPIVARKAKEKGLKVAISTNGLLLNNYRNEIIELVDSIQLNIGGTKDIISEVRQADYGYDEVLENIKNIQKIKESRSLKKPNIGIIYVIFDKSYQKIREFYDFFQDNSSKVDSFYFQHMMFLDKESLSKQSEFLSKLGIEPIMWKGYLSKFKEINISKLKEQLAYVAGKPNVRISPQLKDEELELYYDPKRKSSIKREMACFAPWRQVDIYPNGDILYCPDYVIGNIYEKSFYDIWNGKKNEYMREYIKENKRMPACHSCFYYYVTNEDA